MLSSYRDLAVKKTFDPPRIHFPNIRKYPPCIYSKLNSPLLQTSSDRARWKGVVVSRPGRIEKNRVRRPVKGSYVGIEGRRGERNEARTAHGKSGAQSWHRVHGGGPTLTLASRLRREYVVPLSPAQVHDAPFTFCQCPPKSTPVVVVIASRILRTM